MLKLFLAFKQLYVHNLEIVALQGPYQCLAASWIKIVKLKLFIVWIVISVSNILSLHEEVDCPEIKRPGWKATFDHDFC